MAAMNAPNSSPAPAGKPWGYEHPDCRGAAALLFFTDDLARTIENSLSGREVTREDMQAAQDGIDALLQRYIALRAAPHAFEGQSIVLRIEIDRGADGAELPYVALQTSPRLEEMLIEAQNNAGAGLA
jgi:hypothetical protein